MTEAPSNTSDQQRFDEMFIHLTPRGATLPYNVCYDSQGNIWAATKGGLFKFDGTKKTTLWERKNVFPKKMAAFPQVLCYNDMIIYTCAEHQENVTEMRMYTLNGELRHESFIDGLLISMTISDEGEMYISKQPTKNVSRIFKCSFDAPLGWDEVISDDEFGFYAICSIDEDTLVAALSTMPLTMYSEQKLAFIDIPTGKIRSTFSCGGKEDGQVFFPRTIRRHGDAIVIMDKAGRFVKFDLQGNFVGVVAQIDAFLGNGFCIKDDQALMALSGIVRDLEGRTICDDWLEFIKLDGTRWMDQTAKKDA